MIQIDNQGRREKAGDAHKGESLRSSHVFPEKTWDREKEEREKEKRENLRVLWGGSTSLQIKKKMLCNV